MSEKKERYSTEELEQRFDVHRCGKGWQGENLEASFTTTIPVTFFMRQDTYEHNDGSIVVERNFYARFNYGESAHEYGSAGLSLGDYEAEIKDVGSSNNDRELTFEEVAFILKLDPKDAVWEDEQATLHLEPQPTTE